MQGTPGWSLREPEETAATGSERVLRGGSWAAAARRCRVAYRHHVKPGHQYRHIGFCVAASQQAEAK